MNFAQYVGSKETDEKAYEVLKLDILVVGLQKITIDGLNLNVDHF